MLDRLKTREQGFTLIELLIAIMISGVILSALATGFITTLAGSQNVHDRFVESHDAQLLATYFPSDVQSADPTMINPDPADACGTPTSGTPVIRFQWQENDGTNLTVFSAAYRQVGADLVREHYSCTGLATELLAIILTRPIHTSHVVAHDLSDVQAPNPDLSDIAHGKVSLTIYSHQTSGEQRFSIPAYSYTFSGTMRTKGVFAPFLVELVVPGSKTAGSPFDLRITAKTPPPTSVVDLNYTGSKTIVFSGAPDSPTGTHPTFPTSVNFNSAGVGTATVILVSAVLTKLTLSQGSHLGPSPDITVVAGSASGGTLEFSSCPDTGQSQTTPLSVVRTTRDASGNALPLGGAITVGLTQTGGATLTPTGFVIASGAPSGSFTSQNPPTAGTPMSLTATQTAGPSPGYTADRCDFTTTGTPGFLVTVTGDQTAGVAFDVNVIKSDDGVNPDPDYSSTGTGTAVGFTGAANAPNSTPPTYPGTVMFSGGIGKASITLFNAADTVLTVRETVGSVSGASPSFKVKAKPPSALCIMTPAPACTGSQLNGSHNPPFAVTPKVGLLDGYGNLATFPSNTTVTVTRSGDGPSTIVGSLTIPANATATSATFTATASGSANRTTTFTATSGLLTSATLKLFTPPGG